MSAPTDIQEGRRARELADRLEGNPDPDRLASPDPEVAEALGVVRRIRGGGGGDLRAERKHAIALDLYDGTRRRVLGWSAAAVVAVGTLSLLVGVGVHLNVRGLFASSAANLAGEEAGREAAESGGPPFVIARKKMANFGTAQPAAASVGSEARLERERAVALLATHLVGTESERAENALAAALDEARAALIAGGEALP